MVSALGEEPRLGPGLIPEHHLLEAPRLPLGTGTSNVGLVVPLQKGGQEDSQQFRPGADDPGAGGIHSHHTSLTHTFLPPLWHLVLTMDPCLSVCAPLWSSSLSLALKPRVQPPVPFHPAPTGPGTTAPLNGLLISNYSALTRMV